MEGKRPYHRKRLSNKLSNSQVAELYSRYRDGENSYELAPVFGINPSTVIYLVRKFEDAAVAAGFDVSSCVRRGGFQVGNKYGVNCVND